MRNGCGEQPFFLQMEERKKGFMLDKNRMPKHVAIIMDGNGRWAKKRNLPRVMGHNAGMQAMKEIVRRASDLGIKYLTVYAFSTENWKRSEEEITGIFRLLVKFVGLDLGELKEQNVRVRVFGDYTSIPARAKASMDEMLEETKDNTGLQFNIALNYGGRLDITRAVNHLAEKVRSGEITGEITEDMISRALYSGDENGNVPDPDVIIRTSGEERLSNFLLWQAAYSEFVFTDVLWPDFTPEIFEQTLEQYQSRDRRFGGRK